MQIKKKSHGDRIIPAYAGNTENIEDLVSRYEDHPRLCGEHVCLAIMILMILESSPLMRGTHRCAYEPKIISRIIPAYAGNTQRFIKRRSQFEDHPRLCGEHGKRSGEASATLGSSPLMRGTPCSSACVPGTYRIIPAYAGTPPSSASMDCFF